MYILTENQLNRLSHASESDESLRDLVREVKTQLISDSGNAYYNNNSFQVYEIESITPGNPFLSDLFNMGTQIGTNLIAMMKNHQSEKCEYLILVNMITGKRIKILIK